jgi:hypothetical protein
MRLIYKVMLASLVIGGSLPFTLLKGDDGNPLLKISELEFPAVEIPDFSFKTGSGTDKPRQSYVPTGDSTIYKWTDTEGNLQFSSSIPPDGIEYSVRVYDPNENVIPAVKTTSINSEQGSNVVSQKKKEPLFSIDGVYSPEDIVKLFEDANNIGQMQNQRIENLDAEIGQ